MGVEEAGGDSMLLKRNVERDCSFEWDEEIHGHVCTSAKGMPSGVLAWLSVSLSRIETLQKECGGKGEGEGEGEGEGRKEKEI
jgi:hypothetical protein